jgi:hypothetical protein
LFSGILGLGMRGLTTAYHGTDPTQDNDSTLTTYAPLVETMSNNNSGSSIFSVAMSRDDNRSFISFGGVPPNVKTGEFATIPISQVRRTLKVGVCMAIGMKN